jgi:pimeloyl-ACP methyl ester carboxylesterase
MEAGRVDLAPVLLLHGIGANSLHWRYQLAGLADRFRLIAWNAPGYLLSDSLRAETPSCRDYADALDDLLSALKIDRFDIVANSFGSVSTCASWWIPVVVGYAAARFRGDEAGCGARHVDQRPSGIGLSARRKAIAGSAAVTAASSSTSAAPAS